MLNRKGSKIDRCVPSTFTSRPILNHTLTTRSHLAYLQNGPGLLRVLAVATQGLPSDKESFLFSCDIGAASDLPEVTMVNLELHM